LTNNWSGGNAKGTLFFQNVIDGSDDPNKDFMGGILHGDAVRNNVIRYVYNGMNGVFNVIDGNLVEYNYVSASGDHCNMVFPQDVFTGSVLVVSNNIIRHAACSGGSTLFTMGNSNCTTCTAYVFNNVIYDVDSDFNPHIVIGGHVATGTYYLWNNTVAASSYCIGNGETPPRSTVYYANTHCISSSPICMNTGTTCTDNGGNLLQTAAQANANVSPHFDQYSSSQTYAYSPVALSNSTVGAGKNSASSCSGNLASLCSDATYPAYDSVNHIVVLKTVVPRPAGAAWDIGAYQFMPAGCTISPIGIGPYTAGQSISQQFTAPNCTGSSFTISSGSLSGSGLTLSSSGLLSGTAQGGSFSFAVGYSTASDSMSLTVNPAPTITTTTLATGLVNVLYSQAISTIGGTGSLTCALGSGSLPLGLSLSGCTISGIPTLALTSSFSVTATDANGVSGSPQALSIIVAPPDTSTPTILHTTFCGPGWTWPGTCNLSAPTTAGSRLVVVYSSYNSAGSTPVMNGITDGRDTFSALPNARSVNTNSASSWNDIWTANSVGAGVTALTVSPSTSQAGDVYVWEVQYASGASGCGALSSQPAANPAAGAPMTVGAKALLLSHLHPAPGGNPTAVSSPFISDGITDQMAYAHFATSGSGAFGPQWTQTPASFATGTCWFSSSGSQVAAPAGLSASAN
jgi:hypothetical protein